MIYPYGCLLMFLIRLTDSSLQWLVIFCFEGQKLSLSCQLLADFKTPKLTEK